MALLKIQKLAANFNVTESIAAWDEVGYDKDLKREFFETMLGFMESYILRENSVPLIDLLVAVRLIESKGQAKHLINGNSVTLNNKKVSDSKLIVNRSHCVENSWLMLGKGKSDRRLVLFRSAASWSGHEPHTILAGVRSV